MATLTTQPAVTAGTTLTMAAAASGGDRFTPGDGVVMFIRNASVSPITATFVTPNTVSGLAIADNAVTVAAGGFKAVPLKRELYASSDGLGDVTYSDVTTVTVAVVSV